MKNPLLYLDILFKMKPDVVTVFFSLDASRIGEKRFYRVWDLTSVCDIREVENDMILVAPGI